MEEKEITFAKGIYFNKPHENAPEFVKGKIDIKADEAIEFINANKNEKGYVNLDLLKSKQGKLYLKLNDFKPEKKEDTIDPSDVPFN